MCLEVRLYSSVLWTMPQDSAKMGSKKAMSRGEVLWQLIGFSYPLVGSREEGVAGPEVKTEIKEHQFIAKGNKTKQSIQTNFVVSLRKRTANTTWYFGTFATCT